MDDNTFDDLIKKKLEAYEGPPFDQSSFDALPHTPVTLPVSAPWFANTASRAFVVSSMLLFTLVNTGVLYSFFSETTNPADRANYQTYSQPTLETSLAVSEIDSLKDVIAKMQCDLQQARESTAAYGYAKNEAVEIPQASSASKKFKNNNFIASNRKEGIEAVHDVTPDVAGYSAASEFWHEKSPMVIEKNHLLYALRVMDVSNRGALVQPNELKNKTAFVSLATQKAMDKHYFKVGLEIAPHLDILKGIFKHGDNGLQPRFGIAADLILSTGWSVETGVDYFTASSRFQSGDINVPNMSVGSDYGAVRSIGTKYALLSVPVSVKYRQWITPSNQLFVKLGWKAYASASRELQYNYQSAVSSPDDSHVEVTTIQHHDGFSYFGSTVSTAIGITTKMKNPKNKFELSLFYEKGLGAVGPENLNMQLAGLRAAYWFKIK